MHLEIKSNRATQRETVTWRKTRSQSGMTLSRILNATYIISLSAIVLKCMTQRPNNVAR